MSTFRSLASSGVVCVFVVSGASAEEQKTILTLQQVLARAADGSPEVLAARARVQESRGRLTGASVRFRDNRSSRSVRVRGRERVQTRGICQPV
jgi:hypothetical protein